MSFWSVSEESHANWARTYGNKAYVTTGTITGKILLRTYVLIENDTGNGTPSSG